MAAPVPSLAVSLHAGAAGEGCFPYPAPVGSTLDTCYFSLRRLFGFPLQNTVESPQLQSIKVVDFFFMVHRQISMVLLFSRP